MAAEPLCRILLQQSKICGSSPYSLMSQLQSSSVPKAEPAETRQVAHTRALILTGLVFANVVAILICQPPQSHSLSWGRIFLLSAGYITLTVTAGVIGISIPWRVLKARPRFNLAVLSTKVGVAWIFLPSITLLYRQRSPWIFLVVAFATIAVAFTLRPIFPVSAETNQPIPPAHNATDLATLYGLPIPSFRPLPALFIAICLQGAAAFAIAESLYLASILLATSLFLLAWRWAAFDPKTIRGGFAGKRPRILLFTLALVITILTLLPSAVRLQATSALNHPPHKPPSPAHQPPESDKPEFDYIGIILWPPHTKKTEILLPKPKSAPLAGAAPKAVIIPFDGPYWYFKAPSTSPGPHAHIAHGRPTDVTIRSDNWAPLLMEARQNLGASIDLDCCSEIDVAVTNADTRFGKISIGVVLTDSNSIAKPSRSLGERTILSSEDQDIPINRPPVKEILRFPISRSPTMHRFDQITIVFLPAKERARGGAKVSIQSFTLIPR